MPLLDIAIPHPSFPYKITPHLLLGPTFAAFPNVKKRRLGTISSMAEKTTNLNFGTGELGRSGIMIKGVRTLKVKPKCVIQSNDGLNTFQLITDSPSPLKHLPVNELDDKEKLRRMRISQANKGNTPWNKGRKHNPETIERIRERTRIAMKDPKMVKKRLTKSAHTHSEEARAKIREAVRLGWERRRKKLMLQNACLIEWQKLIAEASRRGVFGEEELQWDSYKMLDEQLEQEWLESIQLRKKMPRPKGSKRAPKSPEQRRKISTSIIAKWADPEYRNRVYSGLAKFHGASVGDGNNTRRRTKSAKKSRRESSEEKKTADSTGSKTKIKNKRARLKRSKMRISNDPLASSKSETLENVQAQRAAANNKKNEAVARAKLLIAEAKNAAKALEISATCNPSDQASLEETRKIIAEAIESLESIKTGQIDRHTSSGLFSDVYKGGEDNVEEKVCQTHELEVNGSRTTSSTEGDTVNFGFGLFRLQDLSDAKCEIVDDDDKILPTNSCNHGGLVDDKEELFLTDSLDYATSPIAKLSDELELNGNNDCQSPLPKVVYGKKEERQCNSTTTPTKKWVRGKLVQAADGED